MCIFKQYEDRIQLHNLCWKHKKYSEGLIKKLQALRENKHGILYDYVIKVSKL